MMLWPLLTMQIHCDSIPDRDWVSTLLLPFRQGEPSFIYLSHTLYQTSVIGMRSTEHDKLATVQHNIKSLP
jgi:hypothetical protein